MSHRLLAAVAVAAGLAASAPAALAQDESMKLARPDVTPAMHDVAVADLVWDDLEVPGFLPGMKIALIHGDPSVADEQYTARPKAWGTLSLSLESGEQRVVSA